MIITSKIISDFLKLSHNGKSITVNSPSSIEDNGDCLLKYVKFFSEEILNKLNTENNNFIIASSEYESLLKIPHVI